MKYLFPVILLLFTCQYCKPENNKEQVKESAQKVVEIDTVNFFYPKEEKHPEFNDYPVYEIYKGKNAELNQGDLENNSALTSALTRGIEENVNFAGKYIFVTQGCGTACQANCLINAENGSIIPAPESSLDVDYKVDSYMIILDPWNQNDSLSGRYNTYNPPKYYIFEDNKFIEIE